VGLALAQASLAIVQWRVRSVLLYESYYRETYPWFDAGDLSRFMGTLDHPLTLSLFLTLAIPFVASFRGAKWTAVCCAVLVLGLGVTQSRTGIVLGACSIVYVFLVGKHQLGVRILLATSFGVVGYAVAVSTVASEATGRFKNDEGSSQARGEAWRYFQEHWSEYVFSGDGLGSSFGTASDAGLRTSFESAFIMYTIDLGIIIAIAYFGIQLGVVAVSFCSEAILRGGPLAGLLACIIPQTYSSLATQGASGPIVWAAIGLCSVSLVNPALSRARVGDGVLRAER
jgi:hypothetical protein